MHIVCSSLLFSLLLHTRYRYESLLLLWYPLLLSNPTVQTHVTLLNMPNQLHVRGVIIYIGQHARILQDEIPSKQGIMELIRKYYDHPNFIWYNFCLLHQANINPQEVTVVNYPIQDPDPNCGLKSRYSSQANLFTQIGFGVNVSANGGVGQHFAFIPRCRLTTAQNNTFISHE